MNLIKLNIVGYSHSEFQQGAFALILSEEKGKRNFSIVIGARSSVNCNWFRKH